MTRTRAMVVGRRPAGLVAVLAAAMTYGCGVERTRDKDVVPPYPDHEVELLWSHVYEAQEPAWVTALALDEADHVLVSTRVGAEDSGTARRWLTRLDPGGAVTSDVDMTEHGVAGSIAAIGDDTLWSSQWLGRYDATGQPLWQLPYVPTYERALTLTQDDEIVMSGRLRDAQDTFRLWLTKVDADGEIVWELLEPPGPNRYFEGHAVDAGGRIFVAHTFVNRVDQEMRRYSRDGELELERPWDCGHDFAIDPEGNLVSVKTTVFGSVLCKSSPELELIWRVELEPFGAYAMTIAKPAFDAEGNIVLAGHSLFDERPSELWVRELTPAGVLRWHSAYPTVEGLDGISQAVAVDSAGDVIAAGSLLSADHQRRVAVTFKLRD